MELIGWSVGQAGGQVGGQAMLMEEGQTLASVSLYK
jgi:hypothetical protein